MDAISIVSVLAAAVLLLAGPLRWWARWWDARGERLVNERNPRFSSVRFPDEADQ
jgi:hypothetical protein